VVWNLCFFHSVGSFIITDELHDFSEGYTTNQEKKSENWGETGRQIHDKNRPWAGLENSLAHLRLLSKSPLRRRRFVDGLYDLPSGYD